MKFKFQPEQFKDLARMLIELKVGSADISLAMQIAAREAQVSLDAHIAPLPVVYCKPDPMMGLVEWSQAQRGDGTDTHRAVLYNCEEIEKVKCQHEIGISDIRNSFGTVYRCMKCRRNLKPTGWKAEGESNERE